MPRNNIRERIVHVYTTIEGDGAAQTTDYTCPEGLVMDILSCQINHDSADNVAITTETVNPNGQTTLTWTSSAAAANAWLVTPRQEVAATQLGNEIHNQLGQMIPPKHSFRITNALALGAGEFLYVQLIYRLRPYSFTSEDPSV